MSTLGALLQAAAGPLAKRVLSALGFGVVTYVGMDLAVGGLLDSARSSWQGMPAEVAAYLNYAGAGQAMAIIAGGITARVAFMSLKKLALI